MDALSTAPSTCPTPAPSPPHPFPRQQPRVISTTIGPVSDLDPRVYSRRLLLQHGVDRAELERNIARRRLTRVRRGWYATPDAHPEVVAAVRASGRLSCVTLLSLHGAWTIADRTVHVRVPRGRTVRRAPDVRLHWTRDALDLDRAVDDPADALRCAVGCLDLRHAVALADSVVNRGVLEATTAMRVLESSPRGRRILTLWDPAAESGIESYARMALRAARITVRSQVVVPGIGRVDLLVGDRLIVELDGALWHDDPAAFERDRSRDRRLLARGYLVLRATYRQVMFDLDAVVGQVQELVRRREHRWQLTQRRAAQIGQSAVLLDR